MQRLGKLFPEMSFKQGFIDQPTMTNNLAATANGDSVSSTIWQKAAEKALTTNGKILAAFGTFTSDIGSEVDAGMPIATVNVEKVTSAGSALHDTNDWNVSALTNAYVPVTMHRISRPFNLTLTDVMHGERIEKKLEAAINDAVDGVWERFAMTITAAVKAGTVGTQEITTSTFNPQYVARTLSAVFGDKANLETLLLNPTLYAALIPYETTQVALDAPGALGVTRGIFKSANMANLNGTPTLANNTVTFAGGTALGLATAADGVLMASATIDFGQLTQAISVRDLGTVGGIKLQLKSWVAPGEEKVMNSVEAMVGFAVGDESRVKLLVPAA